VSAPIIDEAVAEVPAVEATTDVVVEASDVVVETAEAVVEAPVAEEATEEAPKAE
jgi:hypothetical protein